MAVFRLGRQFVFPAVELAEDGGLLAVGGDLSPQRLLHAYSSAVFPWYAPGEPLLWWSPDPRAVFFPGQARITRRLMRTLRDDAWRITFDGCCATVMRCCGEARGEEGTWITPEMETAYLELHRLGYVHSVECWHEGELAGGVYGVALGQVFFGESMFSRRRDASKIALFVLLHQLFAAGYRMFDCQLPTPHLLSLGACIISRERFMKELHVAGITPRPPFMPGLFPQGMLTGRELVAGVGRQGYD